MPIAQRLAALATAAVLALPAYGQSAQVNQRPPAPKIAGEIVISRSGEITAPWKEMKVCVGKTDACKIALVNSITKEIARVGDKWSSMFAPTYDGQEVRRTESARQEAIRLQAEQPAPPKPPKD